jgi:molybdate transport system regulatory protein
MEVVLKLRIQNRRGEAFLGPGPVELLRRIERNGSIHSAAKEMDMSYMKALRLINDIEANVQRKIVVRRTGGTGGGGSELTSYARELIASYEKWLGEVRDFAKKRFPGRALRMT